MGDRAASALQWSREDVRDLHSYQARGRRPSDQGARARRSRGARLGGGQAVSRQGAPRVRSDLTRGHARHGPLRPTASKPARRRISGHPHARVDDAVEAHEMHQLDAMSPRAHLGLRLSGLLLLLAVAAWPRSRGEHHDRAVLGVATPAHLAVTTAARLHVDHAPRPRAARATADVLEELDTSSDPSLNN